MTNLYTDTEIKRMNEIKRLRSIVRSQSILLSRIAVAWNKKKYISAELNDELNEYMNTRC